MLFQRNRPEIRRWDECRRPRWDAPAAVQGLFFDCVDRSHALHENFSAGFGWNFFIKPWLKKNHRDHDRV
jgi:hypothetical protein